jgi:hypothetical protein
MLDQVAPTAKVDRRRALGRTALAALLLATLAHAEARAGCTPVLVPSCDALCDPGSTAERCVVRSCKRIFSSATIDCGERDVWLEGGGGQLRIEDAVLVLQARDLVIGPLGGPGSSSARIEARRRREETLDFGVVLELSGSLDVSGRIWARSARGGGRIVVRAAEDVLLRGVTKRNVVDASASRAEAPGGSIELDSGAAVTITRPVRADVKTAAPGPGGEIRIQAAGDVDLSSLLSARGAGWGDDHFTGGEIMIRSGGALRLTGLLDADGYGPHGAGGDIQLAAESLDVAGASAATPRLTALGSVDAAGGTAPGGQVAIESGSGGVVVGSYAVIQVQGGTSSEDSGAGSVVIESEGDLVLGARSQIEAPAVGGPGDGGFVALRAAHRLEVGDFVEIDARARPQPPGGSGVSVELAGCELVLGRDASLKTVGFSGAGISLLGGRVLTIDADVDARAQGGTPGAILLSYGIERACSDDPARACEGDVDCTAGTCVTVNPTIGAHASFSGATPELIHDQRLARCG